MTYPMVMVFLKGTYLVCRTSLGSMMKMKWRKLMRKSIYRKKSWSSCRRHWKLKMQVISQHRSFKRMVLTLHSTIFVSLSSSSSSSSSLREECSVNKEILLRRLMPLGLNDRLKQRSIILIQQQRNSPEGRQTSWWSTSMTKTLNLTQGIQRKGNFFWKEGPFKKSKKEKINLYPALFLN